MTETYLEYFALGYVLAFLTQLIILIACIVLIIKERSLASVLLLTGSLLTFLMSITTVITNVVVAKTGNPEELLKYQGFSYGLSEFCYLIFAIGLILFVFQHIREKTKPFV
ncbi:MAG: hypothetical protein ACR2MM_07435 [Flavobacteriaceae bacterium]